MSQIRPFWRIPSLLGYVLAAMVIGITSVIGGFCCVHLIMSSKNKMRSLQSLQELISSFMFTLIYMARKQI